MSLLTDQAEDFAGRLTALVNGTVSRDVEFVSRALEQGRIAWIAPRGSEKVTKPALIPLNADGPEARLWLAAHFTTRLDEEGEYLSVETSKFALCVNKLTANSLIRIEYQRGAGREPDEPGHHKRPAAHVQIHGSSTQLGHAQALAGAECRPLEKIHFPVGGRRFRPSLEDFIEFLHDEELLPSVHSGWQELLQESRGDYLRRQLRAAVRREPDAAIAQLEEMGYTVTPDANRSPTP